MPSSFEIFQSCGWVGGLWSKAKSSGSVTFNARAIATMFLRDGLRSPRSMPPRYVRCTQARSASSSWEMAISRRNCLIRDPKELGTYSDSIRPRVILHGTLSIGSMGLKMLLSRPFRLLRPHQRWRRRCVCISSTSILLIGRLRLICPDCSHKEDI